MKIKTNSLVPSKNFAKILDLLVYISLNFGIVASKISNKIERVLRLNKRY